MTYDWQHFTISEDDWHELMQQKRTMQLTTGTAHANRQLKEQ